MAQCLLRVIVSFSFSISSGADHTIISPLNSSSFFFLLFLLHCLSSISSTLLPTTYFSLLHHFGDSSLKLLIFLSIIFPLICLAFFTFCSFISSTSSTTFVCSFLLQLFSFLNFLFCHSFICVFFPTILGMGNRSTLLSYSLTGGNLFK